MIKCYDRKPIILLNEYDTPLQEAYSHGYWKELVALFSALFNTSFKTPGYYDRVLITGITRISKESLFSDVNNFECYSVTSALYADCFGFTEKEVFDSLDEYGLSMEKKNVKDWYDGFVFGGQKEIYNPYSIASFLKKKKYGTYWAETSSNRLVSQLLRHGSDETRDDFRSLMTTGSIHRVINENNVFADLGESAEAVWSLLLGSGYLKADEVVLWDRSGNPLEKPLYVLSITNRETRIMFKDLVDRWFKTVNDESSYKEFIQALYDYDLDAMNHFLQKVALQSFSYFDTANKTPEAFWQGFIIGLAVTMESHYHVTSNRIAGKGRYDVQLKPKDKSLQAFVIELKSIDTGKKTRLKEETQLKRGVMEALRQIENTQYYTELAMEGYPVIRKLGLAFKGQACLIGDKESMKGKTTRKSA